VGGPLEILTKLYDFLFGRLDLFTGGWGKNLEKVWGLLLWSPVPVSRLSKKIF